jgi:hypothetical protein
VAASAAGAVVSWAVSSTSRPSGGSAWKPAAPPPGSSAASGAASHRIAWWAPWSGVSSSRAPQSTDQERELALGLERLGGDPPGGLGGVAQRLGGESVAGDDHEPAVAAAGLRERRVGRRSLGIGEPASARLAPQPAGGDHPRLQRRGAPARLAVGLAMEGLGDRQADVDPHEVHQRERPHAEAAGEPADAVDLLRRGEPLLYQPQRLEGERPVAAIDEEAWAVGGIDHAAVHRGAERASALDRLGARFGAGDDLDQRHQRRRVEEVHADDAVGHGDGGGDRGHAQRGGVGRQHAVVADGPGDRREEGPLELEVLGGRLDDELARSEVAGVLDRLDAIAGRRIELALADELVEPRRRPGERRRVGIEEQRPRAGLRGQLRDARAHGPGSRHADGRHGGDHAAPGA